MSENFTNFYSSQIMAAVDGDDPFLIVLDAAGAPSAPQFRVVVQDGASDITNRELMLVTNVLSGTTFQVTRGIEGTSGVSHVSGSFIAHVLTAGGFVQGVADTLIGCRLSDSLSISHATGTNFLFGSGTEDWDTHAFHDESSQTSRITIPAGQAGKYAMGAAVNWGADPDGMRRIILVKNGSNFPSALIVSQMAVTVAAVGTGQAIYAEAELAVGDYIEMQVLQTSGAALSCDATFSARKIG